MAELLDSINDAADLKKLDPEKIPQLAEEVRAELMDIVSRTGGHLASNLGVVELTIALHRVFSTPRDKIVWDVGHQSYVHKMFTGRKDDFDTLRKHGGMSGFTCRTESEHDSFGAGHASTSISAALGMAVARDRAGDDYNVIAVIGDGAITGGMAMEALNQAGHLKNRLIVILNDNAMSISPTVGALARLFDRIRFDNRYIFGRRKSERVITKLPLGNFFWRQIMRLEWWIKAFFKPTTWWEDMGFTYLGPVNGHDTAKIEKALRKARDFNGPILVHVMTTKGKGDKDAEENAAYFHGVSASGGKKKTAPSYSKVFAETVLQMAKENDRIIAITSAMPEGTALDIVAKELPGRMLDVGICEQHAVTFAAGLATQGYLPVVAIYSTFLQRAFDQIIHDVALQELPMVFAIDRGGIVGDDGKTHQGAFDISYLSLIPNLIVSAPKDENELRHLLCTAVKCGRPMAVRYPRGAGLGVDLDPELKELPIGKGEILRQGDDVSIIAIGVTVEPALEAAAELESSGIQATVINARFAKPLDTELILETAEKTGKIITVEENALSGGFGQQVNSLVSQSAKNCVKIKNVGLPDKFIEHGSQSILRACYGLDKDGIISAVKELVKDGETAGTE